MRRPDRESMRRPRADRRMPLIRLECLETRQLLAIFPVTNLGDSGPGSLRQAILDANASPGKDVIAFDNPGPSYPIISPLSPLPDVTESVAIDGTTELGYASRPVVTLDGSKAGASASGLTLLGGQSTISGLVITGFSNYGVVISQNGGNVIQGNYIGVDVTGEAAAPNKIGGVIVLGSSNNTIGGAVAGGGNVISGNGGDGVAIVGSTPGLTDSVATGNQVLANFIGVDSLGTRALGNQGQGIHLIQASANALGGTGYGFGNVIAGNGGSGVAIFGDSTGTASATSGGFNRVQGNAIGTSRDGNIAIGNGGAGVFVAASANSIGGTVGGAANIIANNGGSGVAVNGQFVSILSNNIYANGGIGIDLTAGSNVNIATPAILSVSRNGTAATVTANLIGTPSTTYLVQFFDNHVGEKQARTFIGSSFQTTDATGQLVFSLSIPNGLPFGGNLSATATDAAGDTSELSPVLAQPTSVYEILLAANRKQVVINFTSPLDPAKLKNPANYRVSAPGLIGIQSIAVPVGNQSVVLTLKRSIPAGTFAKIVIDPAGAPGLTNAAGVALDGNNNGQAGGTFFGSIAQATNLTYIDGSGHKVNLKLANGGAVEVYRSASGDAQIVRLFGINSGKSVLTGTVKGTKVTTPIPLLLGSQGVSVKLTNPPFVIGQIGLLI